MCGTIFHFENLCGLFSNVTTTTFRRKQVRARGASKGNFVHMVMDRLGWPIEGDDAATATTTASPNELPAAAAAPGGRFCLCVGDDVSDEDMFIAAKVR